jgi:hypothetical protein
LKRSECIIRSEPGEYKVTAHFGKDGTFEVLGESVRPLVLTVRVEDVWERLPQEIRRREYSVEIDRTVDGLPKREHLSGVAPDARIFLDFDRSFTMRFV